MAGEGPQFTDIVCFHAEECAEKSLKGLILALGQVPSHTHDLTVLQKALAERNDNSKPLEEFCLVLTDYAVAPRYPGWEDLVGEADINRVLESARFIRDYVLIWLKLRSSPDMKELSAAYPFQCRLISQNVSGLSRALFRVGHNPGM